MRRSEKVNLRLVKAKKRANVRIILDPPVEVGQNHGSISIAEALQRIGSCMFEVQCPQCSAGIKVPDASLRATCPKCLTTFHPSNNVNAGHAATATSSSVRGATSVVDETAEPMTIAGAQPLSLAPFVFAAVALMAGAFFGLRTVTLGASALGLVALLLGAGARGMSGADRAWSGVGGILCALVLGVTLLAPGFINLRWTMEKEVLPPDPNEMEIVDRDWPKKKGRAPEPNEWADATREAFKQDDVLVRIDSMKTGPLPDRGGKFVLVHWRLGHPGHGVGLKFYGFTQEKPAVLTDEAGNSYPFVEQRLRNLLKGPPAYFEPWQPRELRVPPLRFSDFLLVFAGSPPASMPLKLEMPAAAWGRKGVCRLRIPGPFEIDIP
jgi:hypothetical protein